MESIINMKKILFLIPSLSHGGAEKVLVNLVNNMDTARFDITVQTIFDVGINKQFLKPHIKYKSCFKKQFKGNSHLFKMFSPAFLYKHLIKDTYDIIVSYLEGPTARIASGCSNKETKLISWIHCTFKSQKEASVGFRSFDEAKKCYNKFNKTICVSKEVMNAFCKQLCFTKDIDVLYNTIETDEIIALSKQEITDVVFDKNTTNIISVGKISPVKGFMRLAHINKRLLDSGISNHIYILGVGEQQEEIQSYINSNRLNNSFTFLGYKENPYKYVANADIYVCSSLSEGFSTSVTEALIVGTAVVTTQCSGMEEMLGANNEYGIITANDEDALFNDIKKIILDKTLLNEYKSMALERGKSFYKDITVTAVEAAFNNL